MAADFSASSPSGASGASAGIRAGAGLYYALPDVPTSLTTRSLVAGTMYLQLCEWSSGAFDLIGVNVAVAAAATTVRVGIYADENGVPTGSPLASADFDVSTTGDKTAAIAEYTPPDRFWFGVAVDGGANPSLRARAAAIDAKIASSTMSGAGQPGGYSQTGISGALPAISSPTFDTSTIRPLVYVRGA